MGMGKCSKTLCQEVSPFLTAFVARVPAGSVGSPGQWRCRSAAATRRSRCTGRVATWERGEGAGPSGVPGDGPWVRGHRGGIVCLVLPSDPSLSLSWAKPVLEFWCVKERLNRWVRWGARRGDGFVILAALSLVDLWRSSAVASFHKTADFHKPFGILRGIISRGEIQLSPGPPHTHTPFARTRGFGQPSS